MIPCIVNHFQVKKSKIKFTRAIRGFCHVHSLAPCLFYLFPWYGAQMQLVCVDLPRTFPDKKAKYQGHTGHSKCCCVCSVAPCIFYKSLNIWHKRNPMSDDVSCIISRSKGQRPRSHRSFRSKILAFDRYVWRRCGIWIITKFIIAHSAGSHYLNKMMVHC